MAEVPFKSGHLTEPLVPKENVRLLGIKCRDCGALTLGKQDHCINCTSVNVQEHVFANRGKVYMHTVIRHAPPPPYPQDKFKPFPVAWVLLDDNLVIVSEIVDCGLEEVKTDMPVELVIEPSWKDEKGNDVMMYKFRPVK